MKCDLDVMASAHRVFSFYDPLHDYAHLPQIGVYRPQPPWLGTHNPTVRVLYTICVQSRPNMYARFDHDPNYNTTFIECRNKRKKVDI